MNCISLGKRGKGWKVGKVGKVVAGISHEEDGEGPNGEDGVVVFTEDESEAGVLACGEAGMSDIVTVDTDGSSDGGRSDHVSVLVVAIVTNFCVLLCWKEGLSILINIHSKRQHSHVKHPAHIIQPK